MIFHGSHWEECEVSGDCLRCPLSRCRLDDTIWYNRGKRLGPSFAVALFLAQGHSIPQAALAFGVSRHTVRKRETQSLTSGYSQPDAAVFARLSGCIPDLSHISQRPARSPEAVRLCLDCGLDISGRHGAALRCACCAVQRNLALNQDRSKRQRVALKKETV